MLTLWSCFLCIPNLVTKDTWWWYLSLSVEEPLPQSSHCPYRLECRGPHCISCKSGFVFYPWLSKVLANDSIPIKLPWIFPGALFKSNGAPRNNQGNLPALWEKTVYNVFSHWLKHCSAIDRKWTHIIKCQFSMCLGCDVYYLSFSYWEMFTLLMNFIVFESCGVMSIWWMKSSYKHGGHIKINPKNYVAPENKSWIYIFLIIQ